ncbi:hypothetical protein [Streptomyces sp. HUAS TT7]|uniref:hypothetical protein n=1 Tax=Streptomyces sp. HUAS TT7 TaxID=3447507 RepID=UPI003F65A60E
MVAGRLNTFVWVHAEQAEALRTIASENARAEADWLASERERLRLHPAEPTPEPIRREAFRLRPQQWPGQSYLVETAMRARLAAPDLAGPWAPFTPEEREMQRLAGRRPGTPNAHFGDKLALDLTPELVDSAQLAAYRVSAPTVARLYAENLIGPGASRSRAARARREQLQAQIFTLGRIAREAINLIIGP